MDKFFRLSERRTNVTREIVGGITTFLAMSYILAVNPQIISDSGISWGAAFTATALSSAIATLVMAFCANLPVALAPGLGINAFFTFTLRKAIAVALGLFIALIGFANAGILTNQAGTPIAFVNFDLGHSSAIVAMIGLIVTIILAMKNIPGAILLGLVITTIVGIPFGVTTIPEGFAPFSKPSAPYFCKFEWTSVISLKFFIVFFTFLFTDLFDTIGTFVGVAEQANLKDENGTIVSAKRALLADATGTIAGACLGTSTVTSFVESATGIAAGARTGLASVVTGLLFFSALFLSPVFALVPPAATAPALIFFGFMIVPDFFCSI